jgi:hypothetical protein
MAPKDLKPNSPEHTEYLFKFVCDMLIPPSPSISVPSVSIIYDDDINFGIMVSLCSRWRAQGFYVHRLPGEMTHVVMNAS